MTIVFRLDYKRDAAENMIMLSTIRALIVTQIKLMIFLFLLWKSMFASLLNVIVNKYILLVE